MVRNGGLTCSGILVSHAPERWSLMDRNLQARFLLGYGKELTTVPYSRGPGSGEPPYSIERQQKRLATQLDALDVEAAALPRSATPAGNAVAILKLHPSALSRSSFPDLLLRRAGLRFLGTKPNRHRPEAGRGHDLSDGLPVTDVFVAATRRSFRDALSLLLDPRRRADGDSLAEDFLAIEAIRLMTPADRIKPGISGATADLELAAC